MTVLHLKTLALAAAMALVAAASQAATITATVSTGYDAGYGVNNAGVWADAPAIVDGSVTNQYRSPFNELGASGNDYYTVGSPAPNLAPSPAILIVGATDTFSMLWGSIDTYNSVVFSNGTNTETITGSQIMAALGGGVMGATNAIVDFTLAFDFTTVSFYSNNGLASDRPAFEFALANVPLPAAGLLLLTALGAAAFLRRRTSETVA